MIPTCQRCTSDRLLHAEGKSSDLNSFTFQGRELIECYVLRGANIGGGDYYDFIVCLDCGQMQGEWPVPSPIDDEEDVTSPYDDKTGMNG